jgi:hypothetical protein
MAREIARISEKRKKNFAGASDNPNHLDPAGRIALHMIRRAIDLPGAARVAVRRNCPSSNSKSRWE